MISDVHTDNEYFPLVLADGRLINVAVPTIYETVETAQPDKQLDYFHNALETSTVFSLFYHFMKVPQRDKILPIFKMMMFILKGVSTHAKYPLEIMRMMVQQKSLLPIRDAYQVLYNCFVNTKGKVDSHVPADQQMEWLVKLMKKHIKHMYSNKTEININNRTSALPGIQEIADQLDLTAQVVIRSTKHNKIDASDARAQMVKDFETVDPFTFTEGRSFNNDKFKHIPRSQICKLDKDHLEKWFNHHKSLFEK